LKDKDHVKTPDWLMGLFREFYDPCPLFASKYLEPPSDQSVPIFVNPPFSEKEIWIERCIKWPQQGHYVALLLPIESSSKAGKRLLEYGVERLFFERRVWEHVRSVELFIFTGIPNSRRAP
jgi:hypothetical protein